MWRAGPVRPAGEVGQAAAGAGAMDVVEDLITGMPMVRMSTVVLWNTVLAAGTGATVAMVTAMATAAPT
ncbi:MAG: hypothetical protein QOI59_5851 [Gammaproteobacteria bacterium]|nr:hypothetical protein [Gammaproteobacteria bacterium]